LFYLFNLFFIEFWPELIEDFIMHLEEKGKAKCIDEDEEKYEIYT